MNRKWTSARVSHVYWHTRSGFDEIEIIYAITRLYSNIYRRICISCGAHKFYELAKNSFNKFIGDSHKNHIFQATNTHEYYDLLYSKHALHAIPHKKMIYTKISIYIGICHDRNSNSKKLHRWLFWAIHKTGRPPFSMKYLHLDVSNSTL